MSISQGSGPKDYFKAGDWNAYCDVCGFKYKASELRKRWDGMMVCEQDWEPRHPVDLIRVRRERQKPPFTRPGGTDEFNEVPYI
jgi:hypothetical protein